MFVGHFAVAFAAKRAVPRVSLGALFAAAQFLDLLFPVFVLTGIEHASIVPGITAASPLDLSDIPWSHSLVMSLAWSLLFALPWLLRGQRREAVVVALCVFSHWVLDVASHRPDMPLAPGQSTRLGLGLWNSVPATLAVEGALWAAGVWVYLRATRAERRLGSIGLFGTVALLTLSWLAGMFGPPPPGIGPLAWGGLGFALLLLPWAAILDRARRSNF